MSRVYFHSEGETAELYGAERAWLGVYIRRLFDTSVNLRGMFNHPGYDTSRLCSALKISSPPHPAELDVALSEVRQSTLDIDGDVFDLFDCQLNTALALGGDPLKLAARIHGQCETHGYVLGENRLWLADIIGLGLTLGLFRRELRGYPMGWENVADLLRSSSDGAVVMSYSVCDGFPPFDHESDRMLSWTDGLDWLFGLPGNRELSPNNWNERYNDGRTAFDLRKALWSLVEQPPD